MVKTPTTIRIAALIGLWTVFPLYGQKREQKPAVHADFQFGMYPLSRDVMKEMSNEQDRLILVAYSKGWDIDKLAKTLKLPVPELNRLSDKLEDERLVGLDEYNDPRPRIPIIRESDMDRLQDGLKKHTQEFSKLLQSHWADIESNVMGLEGSKAVPKGQVMYESVVSGILLGGMMDAFYEDKTLMGPPPRRGKNGNDQYYGWLVESDPVAAGKLLREIRESDNYRIVSIGPELPDDRPEADDLRGQATVYDDKDAVQYRRFIGTFTRDYLLPYFKNHRQELLAQSAKTSLSYVAFQSFFAWYYNTIAMGVVDDLVAAHRITPPEKYYIYAVRAPM
jgi:hypothetical protein